MSNSEFAEPYTIIEPFGGPFKGDVTVPGDKSISPRAVLFAAMAEGTSPPFALWRRWAPRSI